MSELSTSSLIGNTNEVSVLRVSKTTDFLPDVNYEMTMPTDFKVSNCYYDDKKSNSYKTLDHTTKNRNISVKTTNQDEQNDILCALEFTNTIEDGETSVALGESKSSFTIDVMSKHLFKSPRLTIKNNVFRFSAVGTELSSKVDQLRVLISDMDITIPKDVTCNVSIDGGDIVKLDVSLLPVSGDDSVKLMNLNFSKNAIKSAKPISIDCTKEAVQLQSTKTGFRVAQLFGDDKDGNDIDANTTVIVNSSVSTGVIIVGITTIASIITMLF